MNSDDMLYEECCEFCEQCRDKARVLIEENARMESDLITYEQEMNRILSHEKRERFKRSDELLS